MNIPVFDIVPKLIAFVGIGLVIYAFTNDNENDKTRNNQFEIVFNEKVKYELAEKEFSAIINNFDIINNRTKIKKDSLTKLLENKILSKNEFEKEIFAINEINKNDKKDYEFNKKEKTNELDSLKKRFELENTFLKTKRIYTLDNSGLNSFLIIGGLVILFFGLIMWTYREEKEDEYKVRQNLIYPTYSNNCQSCGKKFNSLIKYANDGDKKNYHYCDKCYKDGEFIEPNKTLQEMMIDVKQYLHSNNIKQKEIESVLKKIENLDRWKINKY